MKNFTFYMNITARLIQILKDYCPKELEQLKDVEIDGDGIFNPLIGEEIETFFLENINFEDIAEKLNEEITEEREIGEENFQNEKQIIKGSQEY